MILNKLVLPASNLLDPVELVENKLKNTLAKIT